MGSGYLRKEAHRTSFIELNYILRTGRKEESQLSGHGFHDNDLGANTGDVSVPFQLSSSPPSCLLPDPYFANLFLRNNLHRSLASGRTLLVTVEKKKIQSCYTFSKYIYIYSSLLFTHC